ncbi:MerR family transcriptional regulator [Janibacter alkaliphilus]|uniref:DNA-binding transcriptional MerR regulator n=1 Tax=Janibacter alkaliphilus TaxID=1069963 RepID=A0A852XDD7_9MICO|nr:DNA-binding transcriptional MerR regulator [Janibacter alkaliphilus]
MLTIGEVAQLAGVTARAVRHYHQRGLLAEPPRDRSGYRRYTADDVVALIRIRTLSDAGVPLARVSELLAAGPADFAVAVAELDRALGDEVRELQGKRARVRALVASESVALPEEVVAYLDRLREAGMSERMIQLERDGWIMLAAHAPEHVPEWIAAKDKHLDTPGAMDFYRRFGDASDWDRDDPRLVELADDLAQVFSEASEGEREEWFDRGGEVVGPRLAHLLDEQALDAAPGWRHLNELMAERGWSGWTAVVKTDDG